MTDTRQRILDRARQMFNEAGIEYVGMRELATALGMRIGNITYYFPTKDDLVFRLSEAYSASNTAIHKANPVKTLYDLLVKQRLLFTNMIDYRCLLLSMVHLMEQNPLIAVGYVKTRRMRSAGDDSDLRMLEKEGFLDLSAPDALWTLASMKSLLSRFWMSETVVSGKRTQMDKQPAHYLKLLANLVKPYATRKGLKELDRFLKDIEVH